MIRAALPEVTALIKEASNALGGKPMPGSRRFSKVKRTTTRA
jgi:hypothetical protein